VDVDEITPKKKTRRRSGKLKEASSIQSQRENEINDMGEMIVNRKRNATKGGGKKKGTPQCDIRREIQHEREKRELKKQLVEMRIQKNKKNW